MSEPDEPDIHVEALERQVRELRAERDKWQAMARKWEAQSKANKADLDTLRAEIAKSARRAALLSGETV